MIPYRVAEPRPSAAVDLSDLLARVATLRRQGPLVSGSARLPCFLQALRGKSAAPGVRVVEHRYPLGYLLGAQRAKPSELRGGAFLSLQEGTLDDGSRRICCIALGVVEGGYLRLRQALAESPMAEAALLDWLNGVLSGVAVVVAERREAVRVRLGAARSRQGLGGFEPAWLESATPRLAGASKPLAWRTVTALNLEQAGALYRRQREGLVSLMGSCVQAVESRAQGTPSIDLAAA